MVERCDDRTIRGSDRSARWRVKSREIPCSETSSSPPPPLPPCPLLTGSLQLMLSIAKLSQVAQSSSETLHTEPVQRAIEGPSPPPFSLPSLTDPRIHSNRRSTRPNQLPVLPPRSLHLSNPPLSIHPPSLHTRSSTYFSTLSLPRTYFSVIPSVCQVCQGRTGGGSSEPGGPD